MATILKAGNVATGAQITSDATGILEIRTGSGAGTTALTISDSQAATFAGTVSTPTLRSNSTSPPTIQNTGGTEIGTFCRAWVNFNGTTNVGGFCTIRGSFNVTSVADNGTGDYTITFTNAMPNANYAWAGVAAFSNVFLSFTDNTYTQTSTSIRVMARTTGNIAYDSYAVNLVAFG